MREIHLLRPPKYLGLPVIGMVFCALLLSGCNPPSGGVTTRIVPTPNTDSPAHAPTEPPPTLIVELIQTPDVARFPVWVSDGIVLEPADLDVQPGLPVADATIANLPDGSIRMYVFAQEQGIRSAVSQDGLSFTVEAGTRIAEKGFGMPRIIALPDGGWRIYANQMGGIGSAISEDGMTFILEEGVRMHGSDHGVAALSTGSIVEAPQGGFRMYYSDLPLAGVAPAGHTIFSAYSEDGELWIPDSDFRFGAADETDKSNSAEHPYVLRDAEGLYWMFFFRGMEIWTTASTDGITWQNETSTGIHGNDPDVIIRADGEWWMYYGNFDPQIGGYILRARRVWSTWNATVNPLGGGPGYFTFEVVLEGSSEKPVELRVEAGAIQLQVDLPPPTNHGSGYMLTDESGKSKLLACQTEERQNDPECHHA